MTLPPVYAGVDASTPPRATSLPFGTSILAAYVGIIGPTGPDTPYIWSTGDWNTFLAEDPDLRVLPIYTHNYPGDPVGDANNGCDAIERLGWAAGLEGDERRILAIDLEILVDPAYVLPLFSQVLTRGFSPMPYGSSGYVKQNPAGIGYWEALLLKRAPTILPVGVQGIQWMWGDIWDFNVFSERVYKGCGRGLRHAA